MAAARVGVSVTFCGFALLPWVELDESAPPQPAIAKIAIAKIATATAPLDFLSILGKSTTLPTLKVHRVLPIRTGI